MHRYINSPKGTYSKCILFLGKKKYFDESMVTTNDRLKKNTKIVMSLYILLLCLFEDTSHSLFYLVRTYHPHLQCAKLILYAHKCQIPARRPAESSTTLNLQRVVRENASLKDPVIHSEVMLKWNTLWFFLPFPLARSSPEIRAWTI